MKKTISLLLLGLLCSIGTIRAGELTIVGTAVGDKTTTGQTVKIHTNTDSQNAVAKFESNIINGGEFVHYYKIENSGGFHLLPTPEFGIFYPSWLNPKFYLLDK